jgi:hypothetical protein
MHNQRLYGTQRPNRVGRPLGKGRPTRCLTPRDDQRPRRCTGGGGGAACRRRSWPGGTKPGCGPRPRNWAWGRCATEPRRTSAPRCIAGPRCATGPRRAARPPRAAAPGRASVRAPIWSGSSAARACRCRASSAVRSSACVRINVRSCSRCSAVTGAVTAARPGGIGGSIRPRPCAAPTAAVALRATSAVANRVKCVMGSSSLSMCEAGARSSLAPRRTSPPEPR